MMTKEEIVKILNLINNANAEERKVLMAKYQEVLEKYFYTLKYPERKELISLHSGILYDLGLITSAHLSLEEREKRRKELSNKIGNL